MYRPRASSLCVALILAAAYCTPLQARDALKKFSPEITYVLKQNGDTYGDVTTYINRHAVKMVVDGSKVTLLSRAPSWQVVVFNDRSKKAFSSTYDEWLLRVPETTYAGHDWTRYPLIVRPEGPEIQRLGRKAVHCKVVGVLKEGGLKPSKRITDGHYIVLKNLDLPPQACRILEKALSCPGFPDGLPLEFYNNRGAIKIEAFKTNLGGQEHFVVTKKIDEKIVDDSFFQYPHGYRPERREAEVLNDDRLKKQMNNLARQLMDGDEK